MFNSTTLITYTMASIVIILAPGPAQALTLANTLSGGKKAGILTVLGLNLTNFVHATAAALGLSAVLATSATAFVVVKMAGAAYLFYLGIRTILAKTDANQTGQGTPNRKPAYTFFKAVLTGLLNPKVALFYLAFLPQFVNPARGSVLIQFLVLGGILAVMDIIYESILVFIAGAMTNWLTRNRTFALWRQRITGAVLVALGARLVFLRRD